ncbi:ABC transporter ATP-binding protein [Candidatus Pollutiaquabacter sp.]|uniref:ABC transporter ATP-binding protein n=1 Tax=Candidatus Pollutiaquabacter sp. TaxID=3416354 RepID=UPI003C81727A|nr:ABC transporter ATP-binding protein [Bacteroidota bacterium]
MTPALTVENFRKTYGSFVAVDDLSFHVDQGDIYGFLGPNGAGKSTTIRALLGLIRPTGGQIKIFGQSLAADRAGAMRRIGSIVEKPDFYKNLSGRKNLELFAWLSKVRDARHRIDRMLELVGLSQRDRDAVKGYSHGMKQRLGLAQALLHDPDLIILDEPTTGLDPQGIVDLRKLLLQLQAEGKTIFLSSHILSEIELIATRMVIINKGRAIVEGTVAELLSREDLVVSFSFLSTPLSNNPPDDFPWIGRIQQRSSDHWILSLSDDEIPRVNEWLVGRGMAVTAIQSRRRLEDLFVRLTMEEGTMKGGKSR